MHIQLETSVKTRGVRGHIQVCSYCMDQKINEQLGLQVVGKNRLPLSIFFDFSSAD